MGKDCISDCLCAMYNWTKVKSYTTRKPRYNGEDTHLFVNKDEFDKLTNRVAYTNRNGVEYCATQEQVDNADIYVIDPPGIEYFFEHYKGYRVPIVIWLTVDEKIRQKRIVSRSNNGVQELMERKFEKSLFKDISKYNPIVVKNNKEPMSVAKDIFNIVKSDQQYGYKPIVTYISHPFQDKLSNMKKIEVIIEELQKSYPQRVFVSPVHCFCFLYEKMSYEDGISWCLELLNRCDEMWVYGDYKNSRGCIAEIKFCEEYNIIYEIKES